MSTDFIPNIKKLFYKIYTPNYSLITENWDDASFGWFTKKINGGFGECVINLARKFEDFGENDDVSLNNIVEIYLFDIDTYNKSIYRTGRRIYCGYISNYSPWINGNEQGVEVTLLGHHTKLSADILKNGLQTKLYTISGGTGLTTTGGSISSADGGEIIRAIITRYSAEKIGGVSIYADERSIPDTASNIKYTFDCENYYNAIERVRQMSPAGYYWYIDTDYVFNFKPKPTGNIHTLYYGVNFNNVQVSKNMERILNTALLDNGDATTPGLYYGYERTLSQGQFGRRVLQKSEKYYGSGETMNNEALNILDTMKDPDIEIRITVLDNNQNSRGYDIESIEVGDTVKIGGFENTVFEEGMVITDYTYRINSIDLIIKPVRIGLFDKVLTMKRQQDIAISEGRGETYTEVNI